MRNVIKIITGVLIAGICLIGYSRSRMFELTFISNTFCGLVYIADGIMSLIRKGKGLPALIWHIALCLHLPVFICVFLNFAIGGWFFFLHLLNPVILFWMYILCASCDVSKKKTRLVSVFVAPVSFLSYALFDLIYYNVTGHFVYGILQPSQVNIITIPLIALFLYCGNLLMGILMIKIKQKQQISYRNRLERRKIKKSESGK